MKAAEQQPTPSEADGPPDGSGPRPGGAPRPQFVAVQARGTIALPAGLRRRFHLDEPGAQVEIVERADGVIELRPALPVAADQRWFWTERWQAMEREVDAHVEAGRVTLSEDPDDFFADLDRGRGRAARRRER